jgi:hypothetical protein
VQFKPAVHPSVDNAGCLHAASVCAFPRRSASTECAHALLAPLPTLLQVVELDFQYPSEGIHKRWDGGYRITALAATPDQGAFVLSIPRRAMSDETQETLRTSTFPSGAPWALASFPCACPRPAARCARICGMPVCVSAWACRRCVQLATRGWGWAAHLAVLAPCGGLLCRWMAPSARGLSIASADWLSPILAGPAEHVKEKWAKDLYIAGIAYGRTVT